MLNYGIGQLFFMQRANNFLKFVVGYFSYLLVHNLLNMPAGVIPVARVNQEDLDAVKRLDDKDLGVPEIKRVISILLLSA